MIPERYASYEKVVTLGSVNFTAIHGDKSATLAKIEATVGGRLAGRRHRRVSRGSTGGLRCV